jgi:hypothetical protein
MFPTVKARLNDDKLTSVLLQLDSEALRQIYDKICLEKLTSESLRTVLFRSASDLDDAKRGGHMAQIGPSVLARSVEKSSYLEDWLADFKLKNKDLEQAVCAIVCADSGDGAGAKARFETIDDRSIRASVLADLAVKKSDPKKKLASVRNDLCTPPLFQPFLASDIDTLKGDEKRLNADFDALEALYGELEKLHSEKISAAG